MIFYSSRIFWYSDRGFLFTVSGVYTKINKCGRPLGLREHPDGSLFIIEANTGLYRVNITTKQVKHIPLVKNADNKPTQIVYNDLVFDPENSDIVFVTISTTRWGLDRLPYSLFEFDDSGKIIVADLSGTGYSTIVDGLHSVNSVEVSPDGKYLLYSLTTEHAIMKIALEDARAALKSGKVVPPAGISMFGEKLLGEPDNIRVDKQTGDILVGMFSTRTSGKAIRDYLGNWPKVRKSIGRVLYVLSQGFNLLNQYFPNHMIEQLKFDFYSGHIMYKSMPSRDGAVFKLCSKTGALKKVLGSAEFNSISEAIVDDAGDLYYGSFRNRFIGRVRKGSH